MKKILILEIVLLVLVLAAAAFFIWQVHTLQPQVAAQAPAAAPTEAAEDAASQQAPAEEVPEPTQPEATEAPAQEAAPTETLQPQEAWKEVLKGHDVSADIYFVYDLNQEAFLMRSEAEDARIYPASITKLFTAYVALQYANPEDEITVGNEISLIDEDSSVANLKIGDVLTVEQLVAGMLLPSGNDAAYALSVAIGRDLAEDQELAPRDAMKRFVQQMNTDAEALGMTGSHFVTPDGNHDSNHYISLADMATVGKLAMENQIIAGYAAMQSESVSLEEDRSVEWQNTNLLLKEDSKYYCDQAVGLKTGYTTPAGYCLLSAVQLGERELLVGVFGSYNENVRYADTLLLLARNFMLDICEPASNAPGASVVNEAA